MRPVNRGNPNAFPVDYMNDVNRDPNVVNDANLLQDFAKEELDIVRRDNEVKAALGAEGVVLAVNKKRKPTYTSAMTLVDLKTAETRLSQEMNSALQAKDKVTAGTKGQDLKDVLDAQLERMKVDAKTPLTRIERVYAASRRDLITNIGQYCSYCEMPLAASLAVEHMLPKKWFPVLSVLWTNFLLACPVCNGHKNDKPSRQTGTAEALKTKAAPLQEDWIADAARGLYLWPNDAAAYDEFLKFFKYTMVKVRYDNAGRGMAEATVPDEVLSRWIYGNSKIEVVSEAGYAVTARILQIISQIPDPDVDNIGNPQRRDAAALISGLSAGNVGDALQAELAGYEAKHRVNFAKGKVAGGTNNGPLTLAQMEPNRSWRLAERRVYRVDASGTTGATVYEVNLDDSLTAGLFQIALTAKEMNAFRLGLNAGRVPPQVMGVLNVTNANADYNVDPLTHKVSVAPAADRGAYDVTVVKRWLLLDDGGVLQVFSYQKFPVELRLTPVQNSGREEQAAKIISDLQLNRIDVTNPKFSDRRMVKRTKTWFVAVESLRNLSQCASGGLAEPGVELSNIIAQTATATGFWSVWWSVFRDYTTDPLRDPLSAFLKKPENFPGTR